MKAPVLATPADWHGYLVGLAVEAWERSTGAAMQPCPLAEWEIARASFVAEARERMAQASQVIVLEIGGGA